MKTNLHKVSYWTDSNCWNCWEVFSNLSNCCKLIRARCSNCTTNPPRTCLNLRRKTCHFPPNRAWVQPLRQQLHCQLQQRQPRRKLSRQPRPLCCCRCWRHCQWLSNLAVDADADAVEGHCCCFARCYWVAEPLQERLQDHRRPRARANEPGCSPDSEHARTRPVIWCGSRDTLRVEICAFASFLLFVFYFLLGFYFFLKQLALVVGLPRVELIADDDRKRA